MFFQSLELLIDVHTRSNLLPAPKSSGEESGNTIRALIPAPLLTRAQDLYGLACGHPHSLGHLDSPDGLGQKLIFGDAAAVQG